MPVFYVFQITAQSPLLPRDPSIPGAQTFAIVVGVSKYKFVRPLAYADKDAVLFRDYLKSPGGGSLKEQNIYLLLNEDASNSNFWGKGFQWLKAKRLQRGDRLFIYLAGHGDAIDEDQFFFLAYDCNPEGDKNNYLVAGAIQLFNLKKKILDETKKGVEVIFVMDACRSNELPGGTQGQSFLNTAVSEKQAGELIMLATGAGQESLEDASIGNGQGLFTYYLVDGLNGVADSLGGVDRKVTFQEIQNYVSKNVPSVAQQRFKRKQDPYFCCTDNGERVISTVDTAYLQKWLKTKKSRGNSFDGLLEKTSGNDADTVLIETYNAFYRAIKKKNISGRSSAEDYFEQLAKKYPGNPYTLDAKSTLAVEYIDAAQAKVDRYLRCGDEGSVKEKKDNYETALNLEKAIASVREDDPDFAKSLYNRLYLLKASGDFGPAGSNGDIDAAFRNAYSALAIDRNGAYIQNKLAQLHLSNNNKDSALFYANKATTTAPNWRCAFVTLALVQKAMGQTVNNNPPDPIKKKPRPVKKFQFGGIAGGGISQLSATPATVSANDTLSFRDVQGKVKYDLGLVGQISIGNRIDIRPSVLVSMETSEITYTRRFQTGGTTTVTVPVKTSSIAIPIPIIIRLSSKNIAPFISAGPTFSVLMQKDDANSARLSVKPIDILGDIGLGVDIGIGKGHLVISPEIKYSRGLTDINEDQNTGFSNSISKLSRQNFTFSIYVRGR